MAYRSVVQQTMHGFAPPHRQPPKGPAGGVARGLPVHRWSQEDADRCFGRLALHLGLPGAQQPPTRLSWLGFLGALAHARRGHGHARG